MRVSEIIAENLILPDLQAQNKFDAIHELVKALVDTSEVTNKDKLTAALLEREKLGSTGIGDNIAIPHAKFEGIEKVIAVFGRSLGGVEFESLDHKPVHYIFLLVVPVNSAGLHLKALARISRLMKQPSIREKLLSAHSGKELFDTILSEEEKYQ